jgi:hypothetical protein
MPEQKNTAATRRIFITVMPPANPDKGWDYSPRDRMAGVKKAIESKKGKMSELLLSSFKSNMQNIPAVTLEEIYTRAEQIKPDFDTKITDIAETVAGVVLLSELKSIARASDKIQSEYAGDASKLRDVLRGSIIVETAIQVNEVYQTILNDFDILGSRNGYAKTVHSSDGYFDAKVDVEFMGISAEIQIHTRAMLSAKEQAHALFEKRQDIQRSVKKGHRPTTEQARKINELNKQMRELFRKAANND